MKSPGVGAPDKQKLETVMIDEGRLNQLIGQMVSDLGGASSVAMVRIGDALGLYKALHANGAMTAAELGSAVGAHERYVREWLSEPGCLELSHLRSHHAEVLALWRAGHGVRGR